MGQLGRFVVQLVVGQEPVQVALPAAGVVVVGAEAGVARDLGAEGAGVGRARAVAEAAARGARGLGLGTELGSSVLTLSLSRVLGFLPQSRGGGQAIARQRFDGVGALLHCRVLLPRAEQAVTLLADRSATGDATVLALGGS